MASTAWQHARQSEEWSNGSITATLVLSSCIPGVQSLDLEPWQTGLPCSVLGGGGPEPEMSHVVYTKLPPALNVDLMQATATETVFGMDVTAQNGGKCDPKFC